MYQIPKVRVDVEVVLSNGDEHKGAVFIAENPFSTPRLEDFLNQATEHFFPFNHEDGSYSLLNKAHLIYLRSSERDFDVLEKQLMLAPRKVAVHLINGHEMDGQVYSPLSEETSRVSDFFNQQEIFLPMYLDGDKVVLNTNMVLWVKD